MRQARLLTMLLLAVCSCLVYTGALHAPFFFDDVTAIVDNPQVRKLWPLSEAMTPGPDLPTSNRPLVALSFSLNYALSGLDVFGYHVVNVALHVANTLLVYTFLLLLFDQLQLAAASALIWCVHPLLSESVVYVTQRTELLAAFFYLAALVCALRCFQQPERRVWQWLAWAAALLGIGAKETAATLSVAIVCLDRLGFSPSLVGALRARRVLYSGLALQLAIAAAMCIAAPYVHAGVGFSDGISPLQWLATQAAVIELYVRRTIWPDTLSVSYYVPIAQQLLRYWPQLLSVGALFVATLWLTARGKLIAYPALLFFIYLAPSSSFVPMATEVVAERRMYVPALAIIFYVVLLGQRLQRGRVVAGVLATLAVSAGLAARTFARVQDYTSVERIWAAAIAADPVNPQPGLELAGVAREAHDLPRARALAAPLISWQREYEGAVDWAARAHISLGQTDEAAGQLDEALAHYNAVKPKRLEYQVALINGARVLLQLKRPADAAQRLQHAIAEGFDGTHERHNLGVALSMLGQHQAAAEQFARAYELDPSRPDSLEALATSLIMQGRVTEAANVLQEVVKSWPGDAAAHTKLDRLLAAQGH